MRAVKRLWRCADAYEVDDTMVAGLVANLLGDETEESAAELAATIQVLASAVEGTAAEPTEAMAASLEGCYLFVNAYLATGVHPESDLTCTP